MTQSKAFHIFKFASIMLIINLLASCGNSSSSPKDSKIHGLATPVILNNDSTYVILSDYFPKPIVIDSINSGTHLTASCTNDTLLILRHSDTRPIESIILFAKGIPYSFVVKTPVTKAPDSLNINNAPIPRLKTLSFTKSHIYLLAKDIDDTYVYWNNYRLHATRNNDTIQISIPPFAKYEPRSHIRVYGYNQYMFSNDVIIPLHKGKVITDPSKLNNNDLQSSLIYHISLENINTRDSSNSHYRQSQSFNTITEITSKIRERYFNELNINTISISNLNIDITDLNHQIDSNLGTKEDIELLLALAHKHGISVFLNLNIDQNQLIKTYSVGIVPSYDDISSNLTYWISSYDFDGLIYNNVQALSDDFWRLVIQKSKAIEANKLKSIFHICTISTVQSSNLIGSGLFDGTMSMKHINDPRRPIWLTISLKNYSGISHDEKKIVRRLNQFYQSTGKLSLYYYPNDTLKMMYWCRGYALAVTLPDMPILLNGNEIGDFANMNHIQKVDSFQDIANKIKTEISHLSDLRTSSMALMYGDLELIEFSDSSITYSRSYFNQNITSTFNFYTNNYKIITQEN